MKIVWERGNGHRSGRLRSLLERRKVAYTTVMTMMKILEQKEYLKKKQEDRAYVYRPAKPKNQVIRGMVREFVDRVFNGSAEPLLLHLVEDRSLTEKDCANRSAPLPTSRRRSHDTWPYRTSRFIACKSRSWWRSADCCPSPAAWKVCAHVCSGGRFCWPPVWRYRSSSRGSSSWSILRRRRSRRWPPLSQRPCRTPPRRFPGKGAAGRGGPWNRRTSALARHWRLSPAHVPGWRNALLLPAGAPHGGPCLCGTVGGCDQSGDVRLCAVP